MKLVLLLIFAVLISACSQIEQSSKIFQPTETRLIAGVGDTVVNIEKEKNLPNVFGKADIFGRKTPTGRITIIYLGVNDGKAVFLRRWTDIETGATTMNSTPIIVQNSQTTRHSGTIGGVRYSGTSVTDSGPVVIPPNTPEAKVIDQGGMQIFVELNDGSGEFFVEGRTIKIENADSSHVVYFIWENK
ncbi:MAG: hypothetical protein IIA70_08400 [Proteobacteria bacterium]|nr:hypothetical protein [Pseudomonadota bacterium]